MSEEESTHFTTLQGYLVFGFSAIFFHISIYKLLVGRVEFAKPDTFSSCRVSLPLYHRCQFKDFQHFVEV